MQDLLSLNDDVLFEVFQYSSLESTLKLPIHIWYRLKNAIKELIIEHKDHCVKWYHRQIWETATIRYQGSKQVVHQLLAKYFGNLIPANIQQKRLIHSQPILLTQQQHVGKGGVLVWHESSVINRRRVVEAAYHFVSTDLFSAATEETCSFESICCSFLVGDESNLIRCLRVLKTKLQMLLSSGNVEPHLDTLLLRVESYFQWTRKELTTLRINPRHNVLLLASGEVFGSVVFEDFYLYKRQRMDTFGSSWDNLIDKRKVIVGKSPNEILTSDGIEWNLTGHRDSIAVIRWHPQKTWLASGSRDNVIKIWNVENGELIRSLEGGCLEWHPFQNILVTSFPYSSKGITVWNVDRGEKILSLPGYSAGYCWHPNGELFIVEKSVNSSQSRAHFLWSLSRNTCEKSLEISSAIMTSFATEKHQFFYRLHSWLSSDTTSLLLCSIDYSPFAIFLYDTETNGICQDNTFSEHTHLVSQIIVLNDRKRFISSSWDHSIIVWDILSNTPLRRLIGHKDKVFEISCDSEQQYLASLSLSLEMKIWLIDSGECLLTFVNYVTPGAYSFSWRYNMIAFTSSSNDLHIINVSKPEISAFLVHDDSSRKQLQMTRENIPSVIRKQISRNEPLCAVSFLCDDQLVTVDKSGGIIKVFHSGTGQLVRSVKPSCPDTPYIENAACNPTRATVAISYRLSGSSRAVIQCIHVGSNVSVTPPLIQECTEVCNLQWSRDGSYLAVQPKFNPTAPMKIWQMTENVHFNFATIENSFLFCFDPHNTSLIALVRREDYEPERVQIWDFIENCSHRILPAQSEKVGAISWHPGISDCLVIGLATNISFWDIKSQMVTSVFQCENCRELGWLVGGKFLVSRFCEANKNIVKLWNSSSGELVEQIALGSCYCSPCLACHINSSELAFSTGETGDVIVLEPFQIDV
jgi:WD40 repeat protein